MAKSKEKKIYPRGKYVLVRQDDPEERVSEFGIISPDSETQEQRAVGKVEAVGSEIKDIKEGQEVMFGAYAGEEIKKTEDFKEVTYRLLYDDDIIAFLK